MREKPLYQQWLERARSNLERARIDKFSRHILYEDMCFDCQQSVEKALKALLVFKDIEYDWTHDIGVLIKTLDTFAACPFFTFPNSIITLHL